MRPQDLAELLLLGIIWGASFMLMRTAAPEFGVFALVEVRTVLAFVFLMPFVLLARQLGDLRKHWRGLIFVGAFNTGIPFCLFSFSSIHLETGLNSILNGTAPMFGAIVAWLYLGDKITKSGVFGLSAGFAGVLVISEQTLGNAELSILPILGALGATFCYGIAACFMKKHLSHAKPFAVAAGSQLFAALLLMPLAIAYWPMQAISETAWRDAIILAVMCTGLAYVMYFRLISNVGASNALTVAYLVPLFGIAWGYILLGEVISMQSILGGCLIIFGVMLTTGVLNKVLKRKYAV